MLAELHIPRYLIGTKKVNGSHAWITSSKKVPDWLWPGGNHNTDGTSSSMAASLSYKVKYTWRGQDHHHDSGVICKWLPTSGWISDIDKIWTKKTNKIGLMMLYLQTNEYVQKKNSGETYIYIDEQNYISGHKSRKNLLWQKGSMKI